MCLISVSKTIHSELKESLVAGPGTCVEPANLFQSLDVRDGACPVDHQGGKSIGRLSVAPRVITVDVTPMALVTGADLSKLLRETKILRGERRY